MEENNLIPPPVNQNQTNNSNPQDKALTGLEDVSKKEIANRKTNKLSVFSISLILLWFGVIGLIYLDWLFWFGSTFIFILILIISPPLAFLTGIISLPKSNNNFISLLFSSIAILFGALLSLPALFLLLMALHYMSGGTGPF
jgi:ABC-type multidrug transport system permease subunit